MLKYLRKTLAEFSKKLFRPSARRTDDGQFRYGYFGFRIFLISMTALQISCYSMYGVNSRDCGLNLSCAGNCLTSQSSLVLDREESVRLLGFDLRKRGESACGLGLGGPCFLPLIPFPLMGSSSSTISITALPGPEKNRVSSIELVGVNHATLIFDIFFDAKWDYTLKPRGNGQLALKANENYIDLTLPADELTIETVHFNFENGDRVSMHDVTLEVETNYGLILVLHHNVATGNPKERIGIISEPCSRF